MSTEYRRKNSHDWSSLMRLSSSRSVFASPMLSTARMKSAARDELRIPAKKGEDEASGVGRVGNAEVVVEALLRQFTLRWNIFHIFCFESTVYSVVDTRVQC